MGWTYFPEGHVSLYVDSTASPTMLAPPPHDLQSVRTKAASSIQMWQQRAVQSCEIPNLLYFAHVKSK